MHVGVRVRLLAKAYFRYLYSPNKKPDTVPRSLYFAFVSLAILTACRQEKKPGLITIDMLEGLKTEKEFRLSEIVDDVEYVKLETTPECLLPEDLVYLVGKKFIIAYQIQEPARIFLFDRQGRYLRKIGQEGKGPLEYLSINALAADPEETFLLVADRNDKLLKFDFQGNVISRINYQNSFQGTISEIAIKNSNEIFLLLDYPILEKRNFYLVRKTNGDLQQVDSLCPVNSSALPVKGGYWWGHGDFYLYNGNINFRPFSNDTLFEYLKGKAIPRFSFPVKTDHLPGPYLIYGIHNGKYSQVSINYEFPKYLIINAQQSDKFWGMMMIYNKTSGELFTLAKYPLPPPAQYELQHFINDMDGIINPSRIFKNISNGLLFYSHDLIKMKDLPEITGKEPEGLKFPDKRRRFIDLIKSGKDDDNPILQIFHLTM